jgi:predicted regulator of Ras-like GTPase activity (Roadblock/LC7/MglB family)
MLSRIFGRKLPDRIPIEEQERALREIARKLPDLRWAAIVSVDGLVQTIYNPFGKQDADRVSAMTAAAISLGERITTELRHGHLAYAVVTGDEGIFAGHLVGEGYVLAIGLPADTEIGAVIEVLAQAASALETASFTDVI